MPREPVTCRPSLTTAAAAPQNTDSPQTVVVDSIDEWLTQRKDLFQRRIEFREAQRDDEHYRLLRQKYVPINDVSGGRTSSSELAGQNGAKEQALATCRVSSRDGPYDSSSTETAASPGTRMIGFEEPKYCLFSRDRILRMRTWTAVHRMGPGLVNLGNTCFLNAVLQCLSYTPPLTNYLISSGHQKTCHMKTSFCALCELEVHVKQCFSNSSSSICPRRIVSSLKNIARHLRFGRQEDAHEFMRYLIEGLQKSCLQGHDEKLHARIKETTVIQQIFGGYLQSEVSCGICHFESNTFDPFMDLSLEIKQCHSVQKALRLFTAPERLMNDNRYHCTRCKRLVDAQKRLTIFRSPVVLTIQLKRFDYCHHHGGKISKRVEYDEVLSIKPYVSKYCQDRELTYRLYAVLVHSGSSCNSGHYYCYVKNSTGIWYAMNDNSVQQVSLAKVLDQSAYILFYIQEGGVTSLSKSGICSAPLATNSNSLLSQESIKGTETSEQSARPKAANSVHDTRIKLDVQIGPLKCPNTVSVPLSGNMAIPLYSAIKSMNNSVQPNATPKEVSIRKMDKPRASEDCHHQDLGMRTADNSLPGLDDSSNNTTAQNCGRRTSGFLAQKHSAESVLSSGNSDQFIRELQTQKTNKCENQFGKTVQAWDNETADLKQYQSTLLGPPSKSSAHLSGRLPGKRLSSYDEEYDRGKQKKKRPLHAHNIFDSSNRDKFQYQYERRRALKLSWSTEISRNGVQPAHQMQSIHSLTV